MAMPSRRRNRSGCRTTLWPFSRVSIALIASILTQAFLNPETLTCAAFAASAPPNLQPAQQSKDEINVIVVGGSSGMGKAAAIQAVQRGGKALLVSRSNDKLNNALKEIRSAAGINQSSDDDNDDDGRISTYSLDVTNETAVESFAQSLPPNLYDALIISSAGKATQGPFTSLPTSETRSLLESKFWGAYHCAKYISTKLKPGGSITFVSGVLNRRPGVNCAPLAITNGALEALTRSLALELGPPPTNLRVNCLSPGFCDTERFDHMDPNKKEAMLKNTAESLPLKRVGRGEDMGEAIYYLATARFVTGVVLDVDGGHLIRQYANAGDDPMRTK